MTSLLIGYINIVLIFISISSSGSSWPGSCYYTSPVNKFDGADFQRKIGVNMENLSSYIFTISVSFATFILALVCL